jgi:hypothetical protein
MRKALVLVGVMLLAAIVVADAAPATGAADSPKAAFPYKEASAYQRTDTTTFSLSVPNNDWEGDLELYWYWTDGSTTRHLSEEGRPSYLNTVFRSSNLSWATVTFEDPIECRWSDPPDPGSDEFGCLEGDLVANLRWDGYGPRHKILAADGTTILGYWRKARVSGSITFNGESLVDWSQPINGRLEGYTDL